MTSALRDKIQKRKTLATEMRALITRAGDEKRALTAEEDQQWTRLEVDEAQLAKEIEREQRTLEAERAVASLLPAEERPTEAPGPEEQRQRYEGAFLRYVKHGLGELSADDRAILKSGESPELRAAQAVGTGSLGGYTVPQAFMAELEVALKAYASVITVARILDTDTGADMPWPTLNDTSQSGEQLGENTQAAQQEFITGVVTFKAFMYSSKRILVPYQLLQDSAFNVDTEVGRVAGERIGRILNNKFTLGAGSTDPQGVVVAAVSGAVAGVTSSGFTTNVSVDAILDLIHSVDPAYRALGNCRFMMHDATLKVIKKLKDSQNRPLWMTGYGQAAPDTINGYQYVINQDMAQPSASAKTILFGDFTKYRIRRVRAFQLLRLNEMYADSLQVGFLGFARYDGRLVDAGTNPIKYLAQATV